ncbi:AMP-binding protein [Phormidium sp. CLA17]|uniref:AMP-dependent synthetase/ligase n=1 Tax=Leptolyngbya sp. Cla-17 TaxID=2803751 RepID=UPI0014911AE0|nr:AMP-binding protein [Leptolyngbya sp. Cla-17]MBM0741616.1 AMP-binding protein [Leptolyngbya sp. Cla-17]
MTRSPQPFDYNALSSIPAMWTIAAQRFSTIAAVHDTHSVPPVNLTYAALYRQMQEFAAGLQALGVKAGDRVGLFSDNSPRWLVADQGIMALGAVDAVRGSQAEKDELLFILENSGATFLVTEDYATYKKLCDRLDNLSIQAIVLLSDETPDEDERLKVLNFHQLLELGIGQTLQPVPAQRDDLATLMYTSGTSGKPKGVMLSHGNLLSQVDGAGRVVRLQPGDRVLSILPVWHCYERTFEYFIFGHGCTQAYTNIRHVKKDLKEFKPHYMVAVPRLWESIYEGVQKQFRDQPEKKQKLVQFFLQNSARFIKARRTLQGLDLENLTPSVLDRLTALIQIGPLGILHALGDRLVYKKIREGVGDNVKYFVSGGGSIAEHLEDFFEIVGLDILGGYGLTETSPITHVRRPNRNLRGADGQALFQTETLIVDLETRQPVATGKQGLVLLRGPQVMQGYYQNPKATQKAINADGWFDTGDLGWLSAQGDLIISGRAKDTIVLTNGENIEPQPIEDACLRSAYLDQIMLVGQDQKVLGALIVPNVDALEKWAAAQGYTLQLADSEVKNQASGKSLAFDSKLVQDLMRQELNREVKNRPGFRPDDRIGPFRLISEPFSIDNGLLTQTLKIRRNVVMDRYQGMINEMFV